MISWGLSDSAESNPDWHFPSFELQDYLLPMIYVGGQMIDEYGSTKYTKEDCQRLRQAMLYTADFLEMTDKTVIRYETLRQGLATLEKSVIKKTLQALDLAAAEAIQNNRSLIFYGD